LVELACRAPPDRSSPFVIPAQHDGGAGARRGACREQRDHVILKPGGRMAISDIVTERPLTEAIVCDVNLWASCIGGAMQQDAYRDAIEAAGLEVQAIQESPQY